MILIPAALAASVVLASVNDLAKAPWIGDGQPERNGADWYAEDPAPEFRAEFVLPKGVDPEKGVKIHVATPGCFLLLVNGGNGLPLGTFPLWSPYAKTLYAESFTCCIIAVDYSVIPKVHILTRCEESAQYSLYVCVIMHTYCILTAARIIDIHSELFKSCAAPGLSVDIDIALVIYT